MTLSAEFEILRDGKVQKEKIKLTIPTNFCMLVPHMQYDKVPRYYIAGGLVFQPLSENYVDEKMMDEEYQSDYFFNLFHYLETGEPSEERREIVVLASVLGLIFATSTVVMGYTVGVCSTIGCVFLSGLELLVAVLQAYIFVFLTTLFIGMSVEPEH